MNSLSSLLLALDQVEDAEVTLLLHAIADWHEEHQKEIGESWRKVANCDRRPAYQSNGGHIKGIYWFWRHGGYGYSILDMLERLSSPKETLSGDLLKPWVIGDGWFIAVNDHGGVRLDRVILPEDDKSLNPTYTGFPTRSAAFVALVETLRKALGKSISNQEKTPCDPPI